MEVLFSNVFVKSLKRYSSITKDIKKMNKERINIPSILKKEDGYLLIVVTMIGLILAFIFGYILPDLHYGQMKRAMNNLNELRAYEAARKGIDAVRLGMKDVDNFQELIGYVITNADETIEKFTIEGNYSLRFPAGSQFTVYGSTANDGTYTVISATFSDPNTEITVSDVADGTNNGVIYNKSKGILWAIDQLCGATTSSTNHDEYKDDDGNVQFVSGCKGINLAGNEDGKLHVAVVVYNTGDGLIDLYSSENGGSWTNVPNRSLDTIYFYDFDGTGNDISDPSGVRDFKYKRDSSGNWSFSIGDNGTYRASEMWDLEINMVNSTGNQSFLNPDNDGDGIPYLSDNDDFNAEVFVIVRSTGITVAPDKANYSTDKTALKLVRDENPHLPNPMRQVLETGLILVQE